MDNLQTGFEQSLLGASFVRADAGDREAVARTIRDHSIDTVMHFAASTIVPESVREPLNYYANNTCATRNLLEVSFNSGVRTFVFSSTAAVYGIPESGIADEESALSPINPYGTSKLMSEWMLRDLARSSDFRYVSLRYFNVAGADRGGLIGQSTRKATLLIKVACEAAIGKRSSVSIFGTDYPTPDGTGIRDYVHVEDLAQAHLGAMDYLHANGASIILNCAYGHGYSVREVLDSVKRISGRSLVIKEEPRRAGDPPILVARADRIRSLLGWRPELVSLDAIVETAWTWEQKLARDPWL
jgi:UDP-glucose 4-epimerase